MTDPMTDSAVQNDPLTLEQLTRFVDLWYKLFEHNAGALPSALLRIALKLHYAHGNGRIYTKMDICNFASVGHIATAVKYLDVAKEKGWVTYVPKENDRRAINVVPTDLLIELLDDLIKKASVKLIKPRPKV